MTVSVIIDEATGDKLTATNGSRSDSVEIVLIGEERATNRGSSTTIFSGFVSDDRDDKEGERIARSTESFVEGSTFAISERVNDVYSMSLCRAAAGVLGGSVTVVSQSGSGTQFSLKIPAFSSMETLIES